MATDDDVGYYYTEGSVQPFWDEFISSTSNSHTGTGWSDTQIALFGDECSGSSDYKPDLGDDNDN